jgi:hypothetical protein
VQMQGNLVVRGTVMDTQCQYLLFFLHEHLHTVHGKGIIALYDEDCMSLVSRELITASICTYAG